MGELKIINRYPVKYVVWSADHSYVAMFSKANIYIANGSRFEEECSITENSRIKSGGWDPCGVFVYTTATHIKVRRFLRPLSLRVCISTVTD